MPIHDWRRASAGVFHDFHQAWSMEIRRALNAGLLPGSYFAMVEQVIGGPIPDVVTLQQRLPQEPGRPTGGALAVAEAPPQARFVVSSEAGDYVARANTVVVRHSLGRVVAVIEIVSPGNKSSAHALRALVEKAAELLRQGINLLLVDLFPPASYDPQGIHKAFWDEIETCPFELPADKPLTVVSYCAGPPHTAYIEPVAVGDTLPDLPLFLDSSMYVPAPLESTYRRTWDECPALIKEVVG